MATAREAATAKTPLGGDLAEGVKSISLDQVVEFKLYVRLVLPLDGFIFWCRADLISDAAILAILPAGQVAAAEMMKPFLKVMGSLHYSSALEQVEDSDVGVNRMIFTALSPVQDFAIVNPNLMYVADFGRDGIRFAFSSRGRFYEQADLYHYLGDAIYATTATQLIDDVSQFSTAQIVSNSLPAWLSLNNYNPIYGFGNLTMPLYPSFLVPQNFSPPYASVHILPESTKALASAPTIDPATSTHTQLCSETVRITLWGTRNNAALDFVDCVYQWSADFGVVGIMNIPVVRDEKRTQAELGVIGMKKAIDFEVSYLMHRMNDIAVQIIKSAIPTFYLGTV